MKKIIVVLLTIPAALVLLTGCGTDNSSSGSDEAVEIKATEVQTSSDEVKDCCKEKTTQECCGEEEKECCKEKETEDCCKKEEKDCCKTEQETISVPDCCGG